MISLFHDIIASLIGGMAAGSAAIVVWRLTNRNVESHSIRRAKVEVVRSLVGMRYIMTSGFTPSPAERMEFNRSLNLVPIYFQNDLEVMRAMRAATSSNWNADRSVVFFHELAKSIGYDVDPEDLRSLSLVRDHVR